MDRWTSVGKGAVIGFLFGTVGLWIIALLALALPLFERIGDVLFAPGRYVALWLFGSDAATFAVVLLFAFNGLLYAAIGAGIHAITNIVRNRS